MPRELWSAGIVDAILEARAERVEQLPDAVRRTFKDDMRDLLEDEVSRALVAALSTFGRWRYRRVPLDDRWRFLQRNVKNASYVFDTAVREFVRRHTQ